MLLEVYVAHACTRPCVCIMPVPMRITCVRLSPPVCAVSFVLGFVIIKYSFLVIFEITILRANWLRPIVSYGNAAGFWSGEGGGIHFRFEHHSFATVDLPNVHYTDI